MRSRSAARNLFEYGFVRSFEWLVRSIPLRVSAFLARRIGDLVHFVLRSKVRGARENAAAALGLSAEDSAIARVVRDSVRHFALVPVELLALERALRDRSAEQILEVRGREHLERALSAGRGCIYLTGHVGNWEVAGALCVALGYPMISVARRIENPRLHRWLMGVRTRFGQQVTDKEGASRDIVRALRDGLCVGMLLDQHAGRHGLRVPFLGRLASTFPSAAHLARRMDVPLLMGMSYRRERPLDLVLELFEPIEPDPTLPEDEDHFRLTLAYTRALETMVRRHPEQYLWLHRRWRQGGTDPDPAWLERYPVVKEGSVGP